MKDHLGLCTQCHEMSTNPSPQNMFMFLVNLKLYVTHYLIALDVIVIYRFSSNIPFFNSFYKIVGQNNPILFTLFGGWLCVVGGGGHAKLKFLRPQGVLLGAIPVELLLKWMGILSSL